MEHLPICFWCRIGKHRKCLDAAVKAGGARVCGCSHVE